MISIISMIFFKICIFKLSDIDQSKHKHARQKIRAFSVFEKSYKAKKETNPSLVHPGISYAHKTFNFACGFFLENVCSIKTLICG